MLICGLLRGLKLREIVIDDLIFRLHYKVTFRVLLVLSIGVAFKQLIGNPIKCMTSNVDTRQVIDQYCFLHSSFSIEEAWDKSLGEVLYPGVDRVRPDQTLTYHTYYQWVSLVLFVQAVLFLIPRYLWTTLESGRMKHMIGDFFRLSKERREAVKSMADDLTEEFGTSAGYFASFFAAELMNCVNVICQIYLMSAFLGSESLFLDPLSSSVLDQSPNATLNTRSVRVFPTVTTCRFRRYGASGVVQREDTMCLLPINLFNAKMYSCLYIWFLILALFSVLKVLHDLLVLLHPRYRGYILHFVSRSRSYAVKEVASLCPMDDWFVLWLMSKNMSSSNFRNIVTLLGHQLKKALDLNASSAISMVCLTGLSSDIS